MLGVAVNSGASVSSNSTLPSKIEQTVKDGRQFALNGGSARLPQLKAFIQPGFVESEHNTEAYDDLVENPFLAAAENPLSTFSIDVDTASIPTSAGS